VPDQRVVVDGRMMFGGGIGTYLRNLFPLVTQLRPNFRMTLLVPSGSGYRLAWVPSNAVEVVECAAPIYSIREQWALRAACPADASLVWSPHYNMPLALPRRTRLAVTVHDIMHLTRPEYRRSLTKRAYARAMFTAVRDRASLVLFDSKFVEEEFRKHVGDPRGITQVAPLGVSDDWRIGGGARPEVVGARPYIVFVGYHKPHKNLRGLLSAFQRVINRIPHNLLIAGRSEGLRTADAGIAAAAASLGDRVIFAGEIGPGELRGAVAHADLLVQPSFDEGFGLPPLEAMAMGCPCLVSRAGSLPEVCADAAAYCDAGDPASIADGIVALLDDGDLRQRLIQRGYERAAGYTWHRCADTTASALEGAMTRL
jgi:glycosyltransferase involved in cell wall biosynthesis